MVEGLLLLELGGVLLGLAVLARLAGRIRIPTIPLYLLAGLAFGRGGLLPLVTTEEFIEVGAELGLILLLFMLGLEYSVAELRSAVVRTAPATALDAALNFTPGFLAGLLFGWDALSSAFLGGVTYVSSSGIVAKVLHDFGRMANRETPSILSLLLAEDLAMALYLPLLAGLVVGGGALSGLLTATIAVGAVAIILLLALRIEVGVSRLIFSHSDEGLLLTLLGVTLVVAAAAEAIHVSAAVGALLVGIVLSGPAARDARELLAPLRDLFAALFFVFFGLTVDPAAIPGALALAAPLAVLTSVTKVATGWVAARRQGVGPSGRVRAGVTLIARGEFSIAIAALGGTTAIDPRLGATAAAYVLLTAIGGPLVVQAAATISERRRRRAGEAPAA